MDRTTRLKRTLTQVRGFTEGYLASMAKPADWVHQVDPTANHALWIAGHIGWSDNFAVGKLAADRARSEPGFDEKFGTKAQPIGDFAAYPSPEKVLAYLRDRRAALLAILDSLGEAGLLAPPPDGASDFFPDKAAIFEFVPWHEALHAGQLSVARRALGHPPLIG